MRALHAMSKPKRTRTLFATGRTFPVRCTASAHFGVIVRTEESIDYELAGFFGVGRCSACGLMAPRQDVRRAAA